MLKEICSCSYMVLSSTREDIYYLYLDSVCRRCINWHSRLLILTMQQFMSRLDYTYNSTPSFVTILSHYRFIALMAYNKSQYFGPGTP
jgi:hypothetical protein